MSLLCKPIQAGSLLLHNRLVMPPIATEKSDVSGRVTQKLIDYYDEKTNGGYLGLVIVEHAYIRPDGKSSSGQLSIADDGAVEGLKVLAKTIKQNGSKAVLQINHAGSAASTEVTGLTPVGPSVVRNPRRGDMPRELSVEDLWGLVQAFADAARRAREAGFDGAEIHSCHGFLLNQFYSPLTNYRKDEYGGSTVNRIRLHLEVIAAIKDAAGKDFPLIIRLGASDFEPGGTTIEDSILAAKKFETAGINLLHISGGFSGYNVPGLTGQGFFAPLSEAIKKVVSIPVVLTGGVTEAEAAERLLRENKADLIGVGRAVMQDSNWAKDAITKLMHQKGVKYGAE